VNKSEDGFRLFKSQISRVTNVVQGWVVQNSVSTILALNQLDLTEGFNAKLVTRFLLNNFFPGAIDDGVE
jgi:hypothetical protein